jgi:hypothetical protein
MQYTQNGFPVDMPRHFKNASCRVWFPTCEECGIQWAARSSNAIVCAREECREARRRRTDEHRRQTLKVVRPHSQEQVSGWNYAKSDPIVIDLYEGRFEGLPPDAMDDACAGLVCPAL